MQSSAPATQRGWLPAMLGVLLSSSACLRKSASSAATEPPPGGDAVRFPAPASNGSAPVAEPNIAAPAPAASDSSDQVSAGDGYSLLTINPRLRPYKVEVPESYVRGGKTYEATVRICVSTEGRVSSVELLKPSIPIIDAQLPTVIGRWIFRPYVVEGQPTPFCYVLHYSVK